MSNSIKQGLLTITKTFDFCYGHSLPGYEGACKNLHGHNAHVEVEVAGRDKKSYQTMVMDFKILKEIVGKALDQLDHQDLTHFFLDFYSFQDPIRNWGTSFPSTAEVICTWLAEQIEETLPDGVVLVRLRVSETPNSWAEWKAEDLPDLTELFHNPLFRQMLADFTDRRMK